MQSHLPLGTKLLTGRAQGECWQHDARTMRVSMTLYHPLCYQRDGWDYNCPTCVKGWSEYNKITEEGFKKIKSSQELKGKALSLNLEDFQKLFNSSGSLAFSSGTISINSP